jgi:hydrogenase nickel incorporation protein HypA/HybF
MHEISLVRSLFRTLEDQLSAEELTRLQAIHLEVGVLSGIEPMLLDNAYQVLRDNSPYADVVLHVRSVPISVWCDTCEETFSVTRQRFICPTCHTASNQVRTGEELMIRQVELAEPAVP